MRSFKFLTVIVTLAAVLTLVAIPVAALAQVGPWAPTAPMPVAVDYHSATLLTNGKVLVAGGFIGFVPPFDIAASELYDPSTGTWTATGNLTDGRAAHTATLLPDGKVLVAGGAGAFFSLLASSELYDPSTGIWSYTTGNMSEARIDHTAILLPNGKVLVVGGTTNTGRTNTAELYDPSSGTWSYTTGNMSVARSDVTLTLLNNGKVLVAGGATGAGEGGTSLNSAELYDPSTGTFSLTGNMTGARADHSAALLNDGRVLVAGGRLDDTSLAGFHYLNTAEIYDPVTGTWSPTGSMATPRGENHDATVVLKNGTVLITGGYSAPDVPLSSAEIYNPHSGKWTRAGEMSVARAGHTATLLPDQIRVLVAGGGSNGVQTTSADLFRP